MPTPLVTQYYPNDFQVVTFNAFDRYNAGTTDGSGGSFAVFYADRDVAVDSIVIAVTGTTASTLQIFKTTSGTVSSPATPLFASGTALTTAAQSTATAGTYVQTLATPANDTNIVRAGNWIGVVAVAGVGTLGNIRASTQIRLRSAIA